MKTLIVDRDENAANLIKSRLEPIGFKVTTEVNKNVAVEGLIGNPAQLLFIDPAPLNNGRQLIIGIRRQSPTYLYIIQMGAETSLSEALAAGANDALTKPLDMKQVEVKAQNARRLYDIVQRLINTDEDFPSAGGVIAKSAFAQLFLAAIDRADRYGERGYVLFMSLRNYAQIKMEDTDYAAGNASAQLAKQLSRIRRQSDILAQTGPHEYALLLQRPMYETEPVEAANRFADTLLRSSELMSTARANVEILLSLVEVPTGNQLALHELTIKSSL